MGGPNSDTGTETLVLYVYYNPSAVATEGPCPKSTHSASPGFNHRLNNYIDAKATSSHLKKFTCKGTLRHVFICLGPPPLLGFVWGGKAILQILNLVIYRMLNACRIWSPTGLHTLKRTVCINCTFTQGRGGCRVEPERRLKGQEFKKLGQKYQLDCISSL